MVNASVKTVDNTWKVAAAMKEISGLQVYVGIPEDKAAREDSDNITNAQLAFIHTHGVRSLPMRQEMNPDIQSGKLKYSEAYTLYIQAHGSPLYSIPARPIIEPAIEAPENKAAIVEELKAAVTLALSGQTNMAMLHLKRAGMLGQNAARDWFTDPRNGWPENSPLTIAKKGSEQPLIDKGELRKSITYVVKND